ncbi:dTDP-4-dehydrorhamnose reductase [subsurface metagenome]
MIWLIGNKGMLGSDVGYFLKETHKDYIASDIEVDITDLEELKRFINDKKIDWIINCSAYTAVDKAEDEPEKAFKINTEGALNIAKIAREKEAKLIHISTDYVFDGEKNGSYTEDDDPNPMGAYGKSKLEGERNIQNIIEKYFILRTAWLYGKNGNNFVYTMLELFKEKEVVKVVSDQWGTPTHTKDLAGTIIKIIQDKSDKYGIYHFTNEGRTNWYEFAKEIYERAKKHKLIKKDLNIIPITTEEYPTKAVRPKNTYMSKEKIKSSFGLNIRDWGNSLEEFLMDI